MHVTTRENDATAQQNDAMAMPLVRFVNAGMDAGRGAGGGSVPAAIARQCWHTTMPDLADTTMERGGSPS
jgi:hypothetical protein